MLHLHSADVSLGVDLVHKLIELRSPYIFAATVSMRLHLNILYCVSHVGYAEKKEDQRPDNG